MSGGTKVPSIRDRLSKAFYINTNIITANLVNALLISGGEKKDLNVKAALDGVFFFVVKQKIPNH